MNISKLIDNNMSAKFKYLPSLMSMDIIFRNDITIINTEISADMFNIICGIKNKEALIFAIQKFKDLKMPFACWIGFDDNYIDCKRDLENMGFACDEHESAMFTEIEKLPRNKNCHELQIYLVDDEKKLNDFTSIYQKLIPHDSNQIKEFYSMVSKHILSTESSLKFFIGYLNNQPISTSALFIDKYTAGIWDVTTLEEFRRKGIGTDMTLHALLHASDNYNMDIGVLTASKFGKKVYSKIGFKKVKDFFVFNY